MIIFLLCHGKTNLCGTSAHISSIRSIENYSLPDKRPITEILRDRLQTIMEGRDTSYSHWVTKVQLPN